ncbi:hypothetical protein EX30DRAFT_63827 [Ascodesmis nigricans]|uniref:Uncharacterized protein n=1 Tax=Ascodesmis nigricans TaxID=341454 RepID=A0A4S2MUJ3_9PEZI|nr:hypothetical protein EX30DRAFT_63827 [Ascodesmis nigricans]
MPPRTRSQSPQKPLTPHLLTRERIVCCHCKSTVPLLICVGPEEDRRVCGHFPCESCRVVEDAKVYNCQCCGVVNGLTVEGIGCRVCGTRRARETVARWRQVGVVGYYEGEEE